MYGLQPTYNGVEVDVLAIGDADCIVVTFWADSRAHRILIDGGAANNVDVITEFLLSRGYTEFSVVICTHPHNDHAAGLTEILTKPYITVHEGWMHDIRGHVDGDALKRAGRNDDGVKQVLQATEALAAAFSSRNIPVLQPFTGVQTYWKDGVQLNRPSLTVLGPSTSFYQNIVRDFVNSATPSFGFGYLAAAMAAYPGNSSLPTNLYGSLFGTPVAPSRIPLGALSGSSVKTNPTTQPFNETSVILGIKFGNAKLLLTGDAGSKALSFVSAEWNHLDYLGVPHHGSDGNLSQQDIERFCPKFAYISAKGDSSHPSRKIVSALVKIGAAVGSTHKNGNLLFSTGVVPARMDYVSLEPLKGTGAPEPIADWSFLLAPKLK